VKDQPRTTTGEGPLVDSCFSCAAAGGVPEVDALRTSTGDLQVDRTAQGPAGDEPPMKIPLPLTKEEQIELDGKIPEIDMTHDDFRVYAALAKYPEWEVEALLKGNYHNTKPFMCGGRLVMLV
jgi:hypothetical protein